MKPLCGVLAAALALAGAPSQAAVLSTDRACYRPGEPVTLRGGPFTPGGAVDVSLDGTLMPSPFSASSTGTIAVELAAPASGPASERSFRITASDRRRAALSGSAVGLVSRFGVKVHPASGAPGVRRRITARGFAAGGTLYAHVIRPRARRTVRVGRLAGACGTLSARTRVLRRNARAGTYRVQFDTRPAYRRSTVPRAIYRVRVKRRLRLRGGMGARRWGRRGGRPAPAPLGGRKVQGRVAGRRSATPSWIAVAGRPQGRTVKRARAARTRAPRGPPL